MRKKKKTGDGKPPAGKPKAGRKPIEWLMLNLVGTPLMQVGVFPGNRTQTRSIKIMERAAFEALTGNKIGGRARGGEKKKKKEPAPQLDTSQLVIMIKEGKARTAYPFSAEAYTAYTKFCAEVEGDHGIHTVCAVPWSVVSEFPHTNVFYLTPGEGPDILVAYRALHNCLYADNLALIALFVSGNGIEPAAVVACENGLVMWQLPQPGLTNAIGEAIPPIWSTADVPPQVRQQMARILGDHRLKSLRPKHRMDPRQAYLEHAVDEKREEAEKPIKGSTTQYGSLLEALTATK